MFLFLIVALLLTVLLPVAVRYFFAQGWIDQLPSFLDASTFLMAFITSVIFVYLYRMNRSSHFVHLYLLSMVIKLVACLIFVVLIVLADRGGAVANAVYFMIAYFIFTTAEIGFLYPKISRS
ncbi:MAG TPA: hypothetical protein VFT90_06730 [Chryseosolibacter sp.]|nr:hypothetical protein [Chryseosolibacter sp.]